MLNLSYEPVIAFVARPSLFPLHFAVMDPLRLTLNAGLHLDPSVPDCKGSP